ncbi:MAG: molybdopterin-synthase adenylyltransferase MoeB [Verrucomicrobia bacterium]|jgi:molybdopterin/thiamine biosynthesis adenylyltransferase/rhodanese-related sulfurtransferase|nr:molybdopterin-synthase adenylyltransferase MoeB [Verrucomicrobiota bacterium]
MSPLISSTRAAEQTLPEEERARYARHLTLPEVGPEGQRRLKASRVLCIGAGGLGSPVMTYLAAAGVGEIGVVDDDRVDFSNLQRQILHGTSDVGRLKTESAASRLAEINPGVRVARHETRFTATNAAAIAAPYDLIIDGTDNFPTRYLSNDLAVLTNKPNVYGSIHRFEGQVSVFAPHLGGPCYRCLFPDPPAPGMIPSCAEGGVLGILPGIVGAMQANEAVKLLLGIGEPLVGRLVHFDALSFRFREIRLRRDPACAVCGESPTLTTLQDIEFNCAMSSPILPEIDVHQLKSRLADVKPFVLLDVREPSEYEVARLPGSLLIPLGELPARVHELDPAAETIIHCKAGRRSAKALQFLLDSGFANVCHVEGGINAWSREIDPSVPLY